MEVPYGKICQCGGRLVGTFPPISQLRLGSELESFRPSYIGRAQHVVPSLHQHSPRHGAAPSQEPARFLPRSLANHNHIADRGSRAASGLGRTDCSTRFALMTKLMMKVIGHGALISPVCCSMSTPHLMSLPYKPTNFVYCTYGTVSDILYTGMQEL